ncbi:hypothetical protein [Halomicronema sp. CCY15110]|uniref:hypothetical protein n=1 Tax=Halomicronema sp. CCY15110 TaxID=2767773 RepID=UPI00194F2E47|nr:hypothetical protein [Halomicronema sp. CCY15110]
MDSWWSNCSSEAIADAAFPAYESLYRIIVNRQLTGLIAGMDADIERVGGR